MTTPGAAPIGSAALFLKYTALLCTLLLLLLPGPSLLPPASPLPPPPPRLTCRAVSAAPLLLTRNSLPANDTRLGPLELRVPGCNPPLDSAHPHTPAARACLRGRHVLFVGDSTMRFQFLNFIHWLHAGSWEAMEPPLERDGPAWGAEGWASFFNGTAAAVPHLCDCARCHGTQLFEEAAQWEVGGQRMLCAMENRYYVHAATGTRASFILMFGPAHAIGWNAPAFLGYECWPHCAQQGCAPGACYPPLHAAPPAEALARLLPALRPTHIVLSSGVWGDYEGGGEEGGGGELAALLRVLRAAPGAPRVLWKTPPPPRPGGHPATEWSTTWHSPRASAAFAGEAAARGWGVVEAGALTAATMAFVRLEPAMPCSRCAEAVEGRVAGVAPHWSCVFCVMRAGGEEDSEAWLAGRHAGLLNELGEEGGRTRAWPWRERDARGEDVLRRSREAAGAAGAAAAGGSVPVEAVFDDPVHCAPAFNRLLNTLLLAHLCEEQEEEGGEGVKRES
jgi:hypothetical protein